MEYYLIIEYIDMQCLKRSVCVSKYARLQHNYYERIRFSQVWVTDT